MRMLPDRVILELPAYLYEHRSHHCKMGRTLHSGRVRKAVPNSLRIGVFLEPFCAHHYIAFFDIFQPWFLYLVPMFQNYLSWVVNYKATFSIT